jgi:hypothetical protein
MEIHNHGKILKSPFILKAGNSGNAAAGVSREAGVEQTEQVQPARLIERLEGNDEVRNQKLVEIQAKVHAGEYSTRAAVERAAEQIVGL